MSGVACACEVAGRLALRYWGVVTRADIDAAAERLAGIADVTPLQRSDRLSAEYGAEVLLKREDLQPVRSYKLRGAFNFLVQVPDDRLSAGVVCASAGNHAQGVALACARLGIKGRVYLPRTTPRQKRERIAWLGGAAIEIALVGDTYDEALAAALQDSADTGSVIVPAFDDPAIIAGQGTVAREIVEQLGGRPDLLVVPVGGGGLLAGCVSWLGDDAPVVGVEPAGAPSMTAALAHGRPVPLADLDTFVDGAALRQVGVLTHEVIAAAGTPIATVSEGALCSELLALYQSDGIIAEPAGALATTALQGLTIEPGSAVVCVISGGNNDVSRYGEILERSLVHEGLKHYFLVEFPQEPGALRRFLDEVLGEDDDITRFEYVKRNNRDTGPALVGVELARKEDFAPLLARMADSPLQVQHLEPGSPLYSFVA